MRAPVVDILVSQEAKKVRRDLRMKKKNLLEDLMENIPHSVYFKDKECRFLMVNRTKADHSNSTPEEMVGKTDFDFYPEEEAREMYEDDKKVIEEGKPIVNKIEKITRPSGEERWASTTKVPRYDDESNTIGMLGISRDITERIRAQEKLKKKEKEFKTLFNENPEAVAYLDENLRVIDLNSRFQELFGCDIEETKGKSLNDFIVPSHLVEEAEKLDEKVKGGYVNYETVRKDKNGNRIGVAITGKPIELGDTIRYLAIYKDITKRKDEEEKEEFLHSLLRHDLRNKAQITQGYLELLKDSELSENQHSYIEKAKKAVESSVEIIEKVRTLRKIQSEEISEIDVHPIIKDAISENEPFASQKEIKIENKFPWFKAKARAGPLLKELLNNIIGNSIQHSNGSKIVISGRESEDNIIITIEDDGKGIPEKDKEKIFERGFKQGENAGTGLGLHMVKRITEIYGGEIELTNSDLGGARFEIALEKG